MSIALTKLQKAFLAKEEVEKLLVNLEELKSGGSISAEQSDYLTKDYNERLQAANSGIAQQRVELKGQLEGLQRSLENNKLELDRIALRFKVGELPLEQHERLDRKLHKRISKIQAEVAELEKLLEATSSSDIAVLRTELGQTGTGERGFSIPEASSFMIFVSSIADVVNPRVRLLGLGGGFLLFISVFMPWFTADYGFGYSFSITASDASGHLVAAGVIFGLLAIAAAFLAESATKGFMHIVTGGISLLILLIAMVVPNRELGTSIVGALSEGLTIGPGLVFYIISAIAVIYSGVLERREA
jgi:hypothetical protein